MTHPYLPRRATRFADITGTGLAVMASCAGAYNRNNKEIALKVREGRVLMIELE